MSAKMLPCTLMRGGTSKGVFFSRNDLPARDEELKSVILRVFGKGSRRGVDGLGGLDPLANKVAVISPSSQAGVDVDYLFLQIADLEQGVIDASINCGNILSAVAPYALEKRFVRAQGQTATVRIRNVNTGTIVHASMAVKDGEPVYAGQQQIQGVPGGGAPIELNFIQAIGSKTGKLFPTGCRRDELGGLAFTFVDGSVPLLIVRAADLGKTGYETPEALNADAVLLARIRQLRMEVAERCGLGEVSHKVYPKLAMVSAPREDGEISSRYFVPYACHAAYAVTGGLTLGVAARIEGTIAHEFARHGSRADAGGGFRIEHPSGHMDVYVGVRDRRDAVEVHRLSTVRTARKIMDGAVFVEHV